MKRSFFPARRWKFSRLAVLPAAFAANAALAQNGTWIADGPGNWSDTANWAGGTVAGGTGSTADFSTLNITGDHLVSLDAPVTIGTLRSQDLTTLSNSWVFGGPATLTLDNGASQPVLEILNRTPTISASLAGSNGFTKTGAGALVLSGNNSALGGTITLADVTGTNNAGLILASNTAIGGIDTINLNGTSASGQYLALSGGITLGSGVTVNLNTPGGNNAPPGAIRSDGAGTVNTIEGAVNITLSGARIANNSARRLDITGPITAGTNQVVFRFGANEGVHITNPANSWTGTTIHSQDTFWFEPGALPATTNLQIAASNPGTVQTSGLFTRALGTGAGQVQFTLSAGRAQGFGARGGDLTLNFGGAGADVLFNSATGAPASAIRTNTLVLNGGTADSNITLVNPLDLNGANRTIQVSAMTAELAGGLKGGNFTLTKTGSGTLHLSAPSTWLGGLTDNNAGIVRISHNEALGPASAVKTIQMLGSNRQTSILELTGGITVDANKTLNISGKAFYATSEGAIGSQFSMRNLSGDNTWLGSVIISNTGGSYGIESAAGTLTLGSDPSTASLIRNTAAANSDRPMFFFGSGNFVIHNKIADNTDFDTGINHAGSGTISLTRADNDFDLPPNLWAGTTEIVSLTNAGSPSSLGVAPNFNLGGTLRYTGNGDSSDRSLGLLQKGATIESSGAGPLVLGSPVMTHQAGSGGITGSPMAAGVSVLTVDNAAAVAVGQTISGTGIAAGTTITAIDPGTRQVTISNPTTAASANGVALSIGGANDLDRTLTLTGTNGGDNTLAADLTDPNGAGKLAIAKTGPGKWILSGATKSYTGPTQVQQGTLGISGGMPAGPLTVSPAATLALSNVLVAANPTFQIDGTLELAGPVNVALADPNPAPGTYQVLAYGAITGAGPLASVYRNASFAVGATSASMTFGAGIGLTWTGAAGSDWDTKASANWQDQVPATQTFHWLDSVTFDATGNAAPNVNLTAELRPGQVTVNESAVDYTFAGPGFIGGSASLVKSGTAKLTVATDNTYTGGTTINAGILQVGAGGTTGSLGSGNITNHGTLAFNRTDTVTLASAVSGTGTLVHDGTGTLVLAADNSYAGTTTIGTGTLRVGDRTATGSLGTGNVINNGILHLSRSDNALVVAGDIGGTGSLQVGTNGIALPAAEWDARVTLTGNNSFSGNVTVHSGALKIAKAANLGAGIKTITLTNGTNGRPQLLLDGSGGNISLPADLSFLTSSTQLTHPAVGNLAGDNTIDGNFTLTSGGGSTAVNVFGGSLTINGNFAANTSGRALVLGGTAGANGTINGAISDGTNPLGLTMSGPNTWTLAGTNSYTAATAVNGGTLLVNGNSSLATGAVTVNSGATLGGTGSLGGNVTLNSGGTLAPGASIESLSVGALNFTDGSLFACELNTSTIDGDLVNANGTLDLAGAVTLSLTDLGFNVALPDQTKLTLISYAGLWNGGTFDGLADDSSFSFGGNQWRIDYNDTSGGSNLLGGGNYANFVTLTVIPEPSSLLLAALGSLPLLRRKRSA